MSGQHACDVADVAKGGTFLSELTLADGSTVPVAIMHTDTGDFYAISDTCTHGEVSLSEGELDGCEIECWAHGGRFDVRTGEATELPALSPVTAYPVTIEGERVLVDVDSPITGPNELEKN